MNPDGQVIPVVSDDQGEGFTDPIEEYDERLKRMPPLQEKLIKRTLEKEKKKNEDFEGRLSQLEKDVNKILIHLGIDDKSKVLCVDEIPKQGG